MKRSTLLLLIFLIGSSCAPLDEPIEAASSSSTPSSSLVGLKTCRGDFVFGPAWVQVHDRRRVTTEALWIASLVTTKELLLRDAMAPIDYSKHAKRLQRALEKHGVEVIEDHDDSFLIVAGAPAQIMRVLESSCDLAGFDLTGFDCENDPASCVAARECELSRDRVNVDEREVADAMFDMMYLTPSYFATRGCVGQTTHQARQRVDFRGVTWSRDE